MKLSLTFSLQPFPAQFPYQNCCEDPSGVASVLFSCSDFSSSRFSILFAFLPSFVLSSFLLPHFFSAPFSLSHRCLIASSAGASISKNVKRKVLSHRAQLRHDSESIGVKGKITALFVLFFFFFSSLHLFSLLFVVLAVDRQRVITAAASAKSKKKETAIQPRSWRNTRLANAKTAVNEEDQLEPSSSSSSSSESDSSSSSFSSSTLPPLPPKPKLEGLCIRQMEIDDLFDGLLFLRLIITSLALLISASWLILSAIHEVFFFSFQFSLEVGRYIV